MSINHPELGQFLVLAFCEIVPFLDSSSLWKLALPKKDGNEKVKNWSKIHYKLMHSNNTEYNYILTKLLFQHYLLPNTLLQLKHTITQRFLSIPQ